MKLRKLKKLIKHDIQTMQWLRQHEISGLSWINLIMLPNFNDNYKLYFITAQYLIKLSNYEFDKAYEIFTKHNNVGFKKFVDCTNRYKIVKI